MKKAPCQSGNSDRGNPKTNSHINLRGMLIISLCPSEIKEDFMKELPSTLTSAVWIAQSRWFWQAEKVRL